MLYHMLFINSPKLCFLNDPVMCYRPLSQGVSTWENFDSPPCTTFDVSLYTIQTFSPLHCKLFTIKTGSSRCPNRTVPMAGKCYLFSNHTKQWHEAREDCQKRGGDLLVIESAEKDEMFLSESTFTCMNHRKIQ